jgi:hypothetical protein
MRLETFAVNFESFEIMNERKPSRDLSENLPKHGRKFAESFWLVECHHRDDPQTRFGARSRAR